MSGEHLFSEFGIICHNLLEMEEGGLVLVVEICFGKSEQGGFVLDTERMQFCQSEDATDGVIIYMLPMLA